MNVKKCETSVIDWINDSSPDGPGLHVYCHYESANEIDLAQPITYGGYLKKHTHAESCYRDVLVDYTPYYDDPDYYWW